jgi:hypothetical protein
MNNNNYYRQCAEYLRDSHGIGEAGNVATNLSMAAFLQGDLSNHYHWKFVLDYIEILLQENWEIPCTSREEGTSAIH